ncbi:thermotolerance [Trichoderma arundinaceum]|uniref:Thermotolerance n=1 Tax=Trichoderma arundinaceum TaxID=490622 RepID=A0A395NQV0_TRIAR|nr:thermotolerance [Trichoderma arundinaceum]
MAFQTRVLRDGEWVTETVNLQAALKASAAPQLASEPLPQPPACGILSQTIVESPVVRWVLPVRLRSSTHNDIAFIGEHFVQISELGRDGQVHDVLRKSDFGFRIRSAVVLGDSLEHGLDDDLYGIAVKQEPPSSPLSPGAHGISDGLRSRSLPPQLLVLILESCQLLFLFIREEAGQKLEFCVTSYENPKLLPYMGYHLAVDPSSRYMAAATPEGIFVVYELESLSELNKQYANHEPIRPIKSTRIRSASGVIHKLEFLFPRPEDDYHIILILIVVRRERSNGPPVSRMATYEWELGDNLQTIFAEEKTGTRLPKEHKMPMLLIPLRFKTAFFAVSQFYIGVVKYALSGSPEFELLPTQPPARTPLHHGNGEPLWVSWARPFRRKKYFEKTDIIYLAREDGAIIHVEIDAAELLPSVTNVGCLGANIDTAFTTAYDIFSDVLIIGGDSGPGGIWKLAPREDLQQVSILPNWSPVLDMTTTNEYSTWHASNADLQAGNPRSAALRLDRMRKQDSIFSASGRGLKGSVVQWRWGIQARIGLDIETGEPIRQAWTFTTHHHNERVLYGLLALPHSSVVLRFSESLDQVDAVPTEDTPFDLTSRTLHTVQVSETIVQVTEKSINVAAPTGSSRYLIAEALGIADVTAENAFCIGNIVVFSTHIGQVSRLHVVRAEGNDFTAIGNWDAQGEVTCVSIFNVLSNSFIVAASMYMGVPWISIYSTTGGPIVAKPITSGHADQGGGTELEALTSISVAHQGVDQVDLVLGTRCGTLITARISDQTPEDIKWNSEALGVARVDIFPSSAPFSGTSAVFACCDNKLILLSDYSPGDCKFSSKYFIWPTDSSEPSMPSPPIHSIHRIPQNLSGQDGHTSLLILAGSRLLLADFGPHVGNVPRPIPIYGTPTRIIFSQTLNCLVVAMITDSKPTLVFVDPDTGAIISVPTDKDRNHAEFISGLGHFGDRIFGLHEWLYKKDGKTFPFILVTTQGGRLIIVSTEKLGEGEGRQLRYWTRYKKQLAGPIFSIVGDAEGLVYCVDRTLHWEVLDLAERKLRPVKEFQLDSPATYLRVSKGKLFALTSLHSLEVIDYQSVDEGTMELIHGDQVSRRTVHMIDVGDPADGHGRWPLNLISDQAGFIAGLWVPLGQRDKEFEVVFEGMLASSVRRFARAHIKPPWLVDNTQRRYGTLPSTHDGSDIIGVSLDGSMRQFSLLGPELWRFLFMIQTLAQQNGAISSLNILPTDEKVDIMNPDLQPSSKMMHIDGDLLKRCLKLHVLEDIAKSDAIFALLCSHLDALGGGVYTTDFKNEGESRRRERYFELSYEIIKFLVASAL